MALEISYTSPEFGVSSPIAYAKIDRFIGNIDMVSFYVNIYADQLARLAKLSPIGNFIFSIPYQDGMTYNSVYSYLKTLPGYENAVDC